MYTTMCDVQCIKLKNISCLIENVCYCLEVGTHFFKRVDLIRREGNKGGIMVQSFEVYSTVLCFIYKITKIP